jgi:hypothetical protein
MKFADKSGDLYRGGGDFGGGKGIVYDAPDGTVIFIPPDKGYEDAPVIHYPSPPAETAPPVQQDFAPPEPDFEIFAPPAAVTPPPIVIAPNPLLEGLKGGRGGKGGDYTPDGEPIWRAQPIREIGFNEFPEPMIGPPPRVIGADKGVKDDAPIIVAPPAPAPPVALSIFNKGGDYTKDGEPIWRAQPIREPFDESPRGGSAFFGDKGTKADYPIIQLPDPIIVTPPPAAPIIVTTAPVPVPDPVPVAPWENIPTAYYDLKKYGSTAGSLSKPAEKPAPAVDIETTIQRGIQAAIGGLGALFAPPPLAGAFAGVGAGAVANTAADAAAGAASSIINRPPVAPAAPQIDPLERLAAVFERSLAAPSRSRGLNEVLPAAPAAPRASGITIPAPTTAGGNAAVVGASPVTTQQIVKYVALGGATLGLGWLLYLWLFA